MRKFKMAAFVLFLLIAAAALGFLVWFRFAEHVVARRMQAPHITLDRTASTDFTVHTLDGQALKLSGARGKVVFLDLWGTWCVQCVAEMPAVQKLYEHYRGDSRVEFLIVSRMDSPEKVRAFARHNSYTLPFYRMHDDEIPATMQLGQFPSTFLYAKDGSLVMQHTGAADWSAHSVVQLIDRLKDE